jgi:23S rRNA pseudouridine1911/1915/1917 synthase
MPEMSRARVQRLIGEGRVTVNGAPAKASARLEGGEQVLIDFPPVQSTEIVPEEMALDIRYEDQEILVINKAAGIVVHPSPGHHSGTLVNGVLAHCPELKGVGGQRRPGIVHRLDKDTSGLIVVAKSDSALHYMQEQFRNRSVKKRYLALVHGLFQKGDALIDAPIGRDPLDRKKMSVIAPGASASSRPAQTKVGFLQRYADATLLQCQPRTGRTHQIRVHLAFAGYPIVGDKVYGQRRQPVSLNRHFLHAAGLRFTRPSDKREISVAAELPHELEEFLQSLEQGELPTS